MHGVFASVASRYDLMNDAMSLGVHRLWKDAMIDWLAPRPGMRLLDVAGGTGDIAFRFLRRVQGRRPGDRARHDRRHAGRGPAAGRGDDLRRPRSTGWSATRWRCPSPDASFDAYTISFGIRNVTRIEDALAEAFRVLRPGGRLMVLEFSRVPEPSLRWLYDRYSFNVIPALGQALAGDRASLPVPRRVDPPLPRPGDLRRHDRRRRLRPGALPQPLDGHRRAALGLEALRCADRTTSGG